MIFPKDGFDVISKVVMLNGSTVKVVVVFTGYYEVIIVARGVSEVLWLFKY